MYWDQDGLWQKAKAYFATSCEAPRDSPTFALFHSLALEFLARSALASVHPTLLADPRGDDSILYAAGYTKAKSPTSIPVKTAFTRCEALIPGFSSDDAKLCMLLLLDHRNRELHTSEPAFEALDVGSWLARSYRACSVLSAFQGKTLEDLLGKQEGDAAEEMIAAAAADVMTVTMEAIAERRAAFEALSAIEKESKVSKGRIIPQLAMPGFWKVRECPGCSNEGRLAGKPISYAPPSFDEENSIAIRDVAVLPQEFSCGICGLKLSGHSALHVSGLGGQFSVQESWNPVADYFESTAYEPDYGND